MAFLTIAGNTVVIQTAGATEEAPERGGEVARAFAGNLRSSLRYRKRAWRFTTNPLTQVAYDSLVAASDTGAPVTCSGDALSGASVSCIVQVSGGGYIQNDLGHLRAALIQLAEV